MLFIKEIHSVQEKIQYIEGRDLNSTFLVHSLEDKLRLQNLLLNKTSCISDQNVMRYSEFWCFCYKKLNLDYKIVSSSFIEAWIDENISISIDVKIKTEKLLKLIVQLQDFLYKSDIDPLLEWLKQNLSESSEIIKYYSLLIDIYNKLLDEKIIIQEFIPNLIIKKLKENSAVFKFDKKVYIDIHLSLSSLEIKAFEEIARFIEIECIFHRLSNEDFFKNEMLKYNLLYSKSNKSLVVNSNNIEDKYKIKSYNTMVEEVLSAIHYVKSLLEDGVEKENIIILSPNIEEYKRLFSMYVDDIPIDYKLSSFIDIKLLLQKISMQINDPSELEFMNSLEGSEDIKSYSDFHYEHGNIYEKKYNNAEKILLDKWGWAEKILSYVSSEISLAETLIENLVKDLKEGERYSSNFILTYLSRLSSKLYKSSENSKNLSFVNITDYNFGKKSDVVIILGLSDSYMIGKRNSIIDNRLIEKLNLDIGLSLDSESNKTKYFYLLNKYTSNKYIYISCSEYDNGGNELSFTTLSLFFEKEECYLKGSKREVDKYIDKVELKIKDYELKSISASKIDSYLRCPFIFYAESVLNLKVKSPKDIDLDPLSQGSWIHSSLSKLMTNNSFYSMSEVQIIDEFKNEFYKQNSKLKSERFIQEQFEKFKPEILRFVKFEKEWKERFPKVSVLATEKYIKSSISDNFYFSENNDIQFSGYIDRVDHDGSGRIIIVDYKYRDSNKNTAYKNWFEKANTQLGIYYLCVSDIELYSDKEVVAALYYSFKDLKRDKGLLTKENQDIFEIKSRNQSVCNKEETDIFLQELRERLAVVLSKIKSGSFHPQPFDTDICTSCDWRYACKANHLN